MRIQVTAVNVLDKKDGSGKWTQLLCVGQFRGRFKNFSLALPKDHAPVQVGTYDVAGELDVVQREGFTSIEFRVVKLQPAAAVKAA